MFLSAAGVGEQFRIPRAPGEWLHRWTNGLALVAAAIAALAIALRQHLVQRSGRTMIIALVSLAALVSLVESFLIYSLFVGMYYSILLFFVFFLVLVLLQSALDLAVSAASAAMHTGVLDECKSTIGAGDGRCGIRRLGAGAEAAGRGTSRQSARSVSVWRSRARRGRATIPTWNR